MKMKKTKAILLLLFVFLSSSFSVLANEKLPRSIENKGSITIELEDGGIGTSKENVEFACTKVANTVDGSYELLPDYASSNIDLNQIKYAKDMEEAAKELVTMAKPDFRIKTGKNGIATFKDLSIGVYLIHVVDKARYDEVVPSLIAIPTWDEKEEDLLFDIKIYPKHTPWPPGTIETDTPSGSHDGVKTGDESPIVLIMSLVGISMLCIAWILTKKKKNKDEDTNNTEVKETIDEEE